MKRRSFLRTLAVSALAALPLKELAAAEPGPVVRGLQDNDVVADEVHVVAQDVNGLKFWGVDVVVRTNTFIPRSSVRRVLGASYSV